MNTVGATQKTQEKFLSQYCPPDFLIDTVSLEFDIRAAKTVVTSHIHFLRNSEQANRLTLDGGEAVVLKSIKLNGTLLTPDDYTVDGETLTIHQVHDQFDLTIVTEIEPEKNTRLEGLYKTSGNHCTQCEAEGFRHITYYLDRPDVMALFDVTIIADKADNPVMLSNGNLVDKGDIDRDRHFVKWVDPWPKPAYLFALVAGKLSALSESFTTKSGRDVALNIYVVDKDLPKCGYAMQSLIQSMQWDEDVFGLEYDLDVYNIVAVGDFNMGAMENKGLNVFNTKYVLADSQTATDNDYDHIQGVIGHEYFHNWTGNRVTCRDWFQLSLKEGLTVFRDQEFSSDMGSRAVKRLDDVRVLRSYQFPEDAGPLAHPIRPEKYIEINNFYTATVYNKGAEVIRMMHNIIGAENFRRGMDIYFERHDGQAVTCEDFIAAMEAASGVDLSQFRLWYSQAGTPVVDASGSYDVARKSYQLTLKQSCPETADHLEKKPFHMPIVVGLVGSNGHDMDVGLAGDGTKCPDGFMLNLRSEEQVYTFNNVSEQPVLSILRGFSAPVVVKNACERNDTLFLLSNDSDPFARWEAGQTIARESILDAVKGYDRDQPFKIPKDAVDAFGSIFLDKQSDPAFLAEILNLPDESYLGQFMDVVDVDALHAVRQAFKREVAVKYFDDIMAVYEDCTDHDVGYAMDRKSKAKRRLKNISLSYLVETGRGEAFDALEQHYKLSDNMTDRIAALSLLCHTELEFRDEALSHFYDLWKHDDLVLDKWFIVQAGSQREQTLSDVISLSNHPDFNLRNPNRVRSLVMAFTSGNQVRFHSHDGGGYKFLSSIIDKLDKLNPQVAARMIAPLGQWRRFDEQRQLLMKYELEKLSNSDIYSSDVYELSTRSLVD